MTAVADQHARDVAVDPARSVVVSAPAGSGKTELLIQRILALLTVVDDPEQVLAMTFTRKAAAEMAARLSAALVEASSGATPVAVHAQRTRKLALAVLTRDRERGWGLLADPGRLQLRTIDSLCMDLVRQLPLLSRLGGTVAVTDDPESLHREAIVDLFAAYREAPADWPELEILLLEYGNRWDRIGAMLATLLERRDQWRDYVFAYRATQGDYLAAACGALVRDRLGKLHSLLKPWQSRLDPLLAARAELRENAAPALPAPVPETLRAFRDIAGLLLTQAGKFRKTVNVRDGFPSGNVMQRERRDAMVALLAELSEHEAVREHLALVLTLPDPARILEDDRRTSALCALLPRLVAFLWLCFQRHQEVDYAEVALAALEALGDDEAPTAVAQRLEYSVEHILVDEFQDTSELQFELVRRLTRGWLEHNAAHPERPRTIMVVGDAMQSIYGFRNANVGLFMRARNEGFNGLALEDVRLHCNFRSRPGLIAWGNEVFQRAFPSDDEPALGAVRFEPATAVREAADERVRLELLTLEPDESSVDRDRREALRTVQAVERALADERGGSVAILVRARGHLRAILALLRERAIAFRAPELHGLGSAEAVTDLMTLTRCLHDPTDRLHGYALLRSPWCGLTTSELLEVRTLEEELGRCALPELLARASTSRSLDGTARQRIARLAGALAPAWGQRDRRGLRAWIESCWLRLGGAATARCQGDLQDVERFFQLLEQADAAGRRDDMPWLERQLGKLYAAAGPDTARVDIMTLHKAKGLEFDHVILPGLQRRPRAPERDLLAWGDFSLDDGQRSFLLAVADRRDNGGGLYDFLSRESRARTSRETTRLLYVAATRARETLTLIAALAKDEEGAWRQAPPTSLLAPIETDFLASATAIEAPKGPEHGRSEGTATEAGPRLFRLQAPPAGNCSMVAGPEPESEGVPFSYCPDRGPRLRGTALHRALAELAGRARLPEAGSAELAPLCERTLLSCGVDPGQDPSAAAWMERHLNCTLSDAVRGRWLLSSEHEDSVCEWSLLAEDDEGSEHEYVLDRAFRCARTGERWVVDYKSGEAAPGESRAAFLTAVTERYRAQLERYRQLMEAHYGEPCRAALYLTGSADWIEFPRAPVAVGSPGL